MRKVSDLLKETREEKKLTLDTVETETKIKKEFLSAIERGQFERLPSETYALGFVKNYARFLGLSPVKIVPLFRREYESKSKVNIVPEFRKTQGKFNKKFFLGTKSFLGAAVVLIVFAFIFFQFSSLIFPPDLSVISPKDNLKIEGNVIEVSGKTDPYNTVFVQGSEAYVNLQGNFKKSVYLFSGENKISIIAKNRFGKETKKDIRVNIQ